MSSPTQNLKMAERGALLAIATYILLSILKIIAGHFFRSASRLYHLKIDKDQLTPCAPRDLASLFSYLGVVYGALA